MVLVEELLTGLVLPAVTADALLAALADPLEAEACVAPPGWATAISAITEAVIRALTGLRGPTRVAPKPTGVFVLTGMP